MPFDSEHGPFKDQYNKSNLVNIHIRCAARLDSLKCEYANGKWSYKHGANGGKPELFHMKNDEAIITVWIWRTDSQVHAIQFQTNTGRLSPKYGDFIGTGGPFVYRGYDKELKVERALMGFKGRASNEIDFLEPVWSNTHILDARHVTVGDYKGGFVGDGHFDQLSKVSDPFKTTLKAIIIRAAAEVDAIECIFHTADDGEKKSGRAGGPGGTEYVFTLGKNERIVSVVGRASARIDSLQFITNTGSTGAPFVYRGYDKELKAERALMGFKGHASNEIDSVEPVWSNTRILDARHVTVGDYMGGFVGDGHFDQLSKVSDPFKTTLQAIIVRAAAEVDAIECIFHTVDDGEQKSGRAGGPGGTEYVFTLGKNERIVSIAGRASARIDSLQFTTNTGRHSEVYGGPGGEPFVLKPPFKGTDGSSDANMSLLCFQGRAAPTPNYGNAITIHGLAPVWAPDPPVSFSLSIDKFAEEDLFRIAKGNGGAPEIAHKVSKEVENTNMGDIQSKMTFQMQTTKSTSITLSNTTRNKVGGKLVLSVKCKGKAGVPLVAEGELEYSAQIEVAGEHEWGRTVTDGQAITKAFTEVHEDIVKVQPGQKLIGTVIAYKVVATDVKWTGKLTVTYAGGGTQIFDADGTFDSVSCTKLNIEYQTVSL
ncbi:hypothetical protein GYMLUDRAFT_266193 [Collybiopsis luxurians FD-317 M1]|uniref:Jacalin-type lectin domain-containing protein n=1 Tax=Collybiopsis luxurians FD-317 M1 TaxID=944289 RepID=A0A0D0AJF9_9AGAR|nr:hypothetical protein GYMLUDRAFT_266193 [Collybiopsis luxurians FD-317 M1]